MSRSSLHVETIETPSLGDRSYLVHDGEVAVVIDPQRDIDRITARAEEVGVRITHVAETHVHNDYVSGGLTLAQVTGATYLHAAAESLPFDHRPVHDGDVVQVGRLQLEVVHTPGHTAHHLSFIITGSGATPAVFTGGSLLLGTVGRTDLVSADATEALTRAQYRSAHALADRLPDDASIFPTHGFGSFCAAASSDDDSDGTLATERTVNLALTAPNEDDFVERMLTDLDDYPSYYAHMGPLNRAGGVAVDLSPPAAVDPVELAQRIHRGEWIVDLRPRREFAAAHLAGTIGIELADGLSTYLAWLAPWGMPLTLLADDPDAIADAQRQLVRIGIDRVSGAAQGSPDTWVPDPDRRSYPVVEFRDLDGDDLPVVLDVRRAGEFADGHLAGASNVPIHELEARHDDVPDGVVHVHCASGYRASIAASLLDRMGHDVVLIDDDFSHAADAGLPMA